MNYRVALDNYAADAVSPVSKGSHYYWGTPIFYFNFLINEHLILVNMNLIRGISIG